MIAVDWDPSARKLRQFGAIATVVLLAAAALAHARGRAVPLQAVPLAIGVVVGTLAIVRPHRLRLAYVLLAYAVYPIGWVVSHAILLVVFYGVITPLGMLARLARSDLLEIEPRARDRSYWHPRTRRRDKASYLRQA